jgi:Class II Aldolase and Adducin N-terminal domain
VTLTTADGRGRARCVVRLRDGCPVSSAVLDDANVKLASTEISVHRAIYQGTAAQAIVHAHPPYAIARSLMCDEILPIDSEGSYLLHKVPVAHTELTAGSTEVADLLPQRLKEYDIVMLRGHGPFAIGHLLQEAYHQRARDVVPHHDHRRRARRAGKGIPQRVGPVRDMVNVRKPFAGAR